MYDPTIAALGCQQPAAMCCHHHTLPEKSFDTLPQAHTRAVGTSEIPRRTTSAKAVVPHHATAVLHLKVLKNESQGLSQSC